MQFAGRFTEKRALAITLCWVVALALAGSTDVVLFLAPALLIAIPLVCGRYPGEELIARIIARQPRKPAKANRLLPRIPSGPETWRPTGTLLIAFSLAKRPPPFGLLAQN